MVTIVTSFGYRKSYVSFVMSIHDSIYAEGLVNIGPVDAEIFGGIYADFCRLIQQGVGLVVTLVIFGVTGPIFINYAQDALRYCHWKFFNGTAVYRTVLERQLAE